MGMRHPPEEDLKSILLEMHFSLTTIDCKLDSLTRRLDDMKDHIDKYELCLTDNEQQISDVDDVQTLQVKDVEEIKCWPYTRLSVAPRVPFSLLEIDHRYLDHRRYDVLIYLTNLRHDVLHYIITP
ncbi:hypothetical protein NDU88_005118 [Pleurodeles waltl]|uniref:Uncharacterized protein n=1 Tax=Pleurodeles waltl TaxID=8319 RepID=A0AAV7X087_PLEWA|nr:hypothetical protein NDU88_005118 [Pleurodeles waltl]